MKRIFIFLLICLSTNSFSQQQEAQYYYPLQVGNCWQFSEGHNLYNECRVVSDSIVSNNKKYAKVEGVYLNGYYRTEGSKVYTYQASLNREVVFYDFSMNVGDTVSRIVYHGTTHIITVNSKGTKNIFGQQLSYMRFFRDDIHSTGDGFYTIVYGIGLESYVGELMHYNCTGAIIDGKQYGVILNVANPNNNIPALPSLSQNYPNPFNPSTTIEYAIPKSELVTLKVYDVLGREVATLVNEYKQAGMYKANFNASGLVSGVYFYQLSAGSYVETKKLIMMK